MPEEQKRISNNSKVDYKTTELAFCFLADVYIIVLIASLCLIENKQMIAGSQVISYRTTHY